ncbi:unnamed protein product [Paramecium sonneborni]|uniref:Transmembrane protein n=1 Tax=Paramecium sonneborni TaxID=65129 RepID=A0A8S1RN39_9CILI|nr:unnamed protein product [Paramecium sonneborni]
MIYFFSLQILAIKIKAFELVEMDSSYQYSSEIIDLKQLGESEEISYGYGIWSKYNPLSTISQVGMIGLFDSDCFHISNVVDQQTLSLNLIYYDCLDFHLQQIQKTIQFIDNEGKQHKYQLNIDNFEYENVWFYFQLLQWPKLSRLELIIFQLGKASMKKSLVIQHPFNDIKIQINYGGGLKVQKSLITSIELGKQFSFFPGKMILSKFRILQQTPDQDFEQLAIEAFEPYKNCICQNSEIVEIFDVDIKYLSKLTFLSDQLNCDSYILSGWFKIIEILSESNEFIYQLLKLSSNYEGQLSDSNLSPFQLFYYISNFGNQILITTYSYLFPQVNINFKDNPYLITDKFEITNLLSFWHFINIQQIENNLKILIKIFEVDHISEYFTQIEVKQFHNLRLKLQYGNILQNCKDYLNIQYRKLILHNCEQYIDQNNCHYSCESCNGPSKFDCLSCSLESHRIYISKFQACVCPYNMIDDKICKSYKDLELQLIQGYKNDKLCEYGYFEYQGDCLKCPSIVRENRISCGDCLQNPKDWSKNSECTYNLYLNSQEDTQELDVKSGYYVLFDGDNINYCLYCNQQNSFVVDGHDINFEIENSASSQHWCNDYLNNCLYCIFSIGEQICQKCQYGYNLINNKCTKIDETEIICLDRQYITSRKTCRYCSIKNCKYCFEYQNDLSKCTLYKEFETFNTDEEIKIGCALCDNNYIFDFTSEQCIYKVPSIQQCIRSFINLNGNEICTLAAIDDFNIAPEIQNCQKYQPFCQTCIKSPQNIIKCIICNIGYTASIINGGCYLSKEKDLQTKIMIEGDYSSQNGWIQRIQGFMMKFLPNQYFYPHSDVFVSTVEIRVDCIDGYSLSEHRQCLKSCSSECLTCIESPYYGFVCQKCPLNQYLKPIRLQDQGICFECTQLCQICEIRSNYEIYTLQPTFIIKDDNIHYTFKCLKPIQDPYVYLDPYDSIAKHCLDDINCQPQLLHLSNYQYCEAIDQTWENSININYCNQMGIDTMIINVNFLESSTIYCYLESFLAQNFLKSKIFPLRKIYFQFTSAEIMILRTGTNILIINYDILEICNVTFQKSKNEVFIIKNNNQVVDLHLFNFSIADSYITNTSSIFQTDIFKDVLLINVAIINCTFLNSTFLNFVKFPISGNIQIENLQIKNCTFIQSELFIIKLMQGSIQIVNLEIEETYLYNSTLYSINSNFLNSIIKFHNFIIRNNKFYHSSFQKSNSNLHQNLVDIIFSQNYLSNSNTFDFNHNFTISNILITQNDFKDSAFFFTTETLLLFQLTLKLHFLKAKDNYFTSSNIWKIQSSLETSNLILSLSELLLEDLYSSNQLQYLFKLKCQKLLLEDVFIKNLSNTFIFYIYQSNFIYLNNIIYEGSSIQYQIPLIQSCQEITKQQNKLLKIMGFYQIQIKKLEISHIFNLDESSIDINNNNEELNTGQQLVQIQDIVFKQNLVVLLNLIEFTSLLKIHSERNLNIIITNIEYLQNIFHSYADSSFKSYSSLIYLNCKTCIVEINNYSSQFNVFSNSTNSFVYINSKIINFNNYSVENHNILPSRLWSKYFDFEINGDYNQDEINQIISQALMIKNIGGVAQLTTSNFTCINCSFQKIKAFKSAVFEIITEQDGIIQLLELSISQIEHNLQSLTNSSGCISIYSQNSFLNLKIQNSYFSEILSRMAPSIFTIIPSSIQNTIQITNIKITNCLSLINSILKASFQNKIAQQNKISFSSIIIIQSEENWIKYFSKIEALTTVEIEEITSEENALIYFDSCSVNVKNLIISGLYLSPLLKVSNIPNFNLHNVLLEQIQIFYSFNVIDIQQALKTQSTVILQQLSIINTQPYQALFTQNMVSKNIYVNKNCVKTIIHIDERFSTFLNIQSLFLIQAKNSSLINIKCDQDTNRYKLNLIKLQKNNCTFCTHGLIYFNVQKLQHLRILDLDCNSNLIQSYGCLNLVQSAIKSQFITAINSYFINNSGSKGVAISSSGIPLILKNCWIINNNASQQGGGLYLDLHNSSFLIKKSFIIQNRAFSGGGLYLEKNNNVNINNFIDSLLILNKANSYGNNLVESPTSLALSINSNQMQSSSLILNYTQTNILFLKSYTTIEQEQKIRSELLRIPSNQVIRDYNILIPKQSTSYKLFKDLSISFKNSENEMLFHQLNSTCNVSQQVIFKDKIQSSIQLGELIYNETKNNFDMGSLSFHFNPYENNNSFLQIIITCNPQNYSKKLEYIIRAKSYKCQLGEFYVDEGCQLCQSNQGFYSVTYNDTKCSIFDKQKFQSITSNELNLQVGYWRPHYLSDQINYCFKNFENCKGGWSVGNELCIEGHLGALCEECDIYNIRGGGKYFKNSENSKCWSCFGISDSIIPFVMNSIWAMLSVLLSLRSINKSNDLFIFLKIKERFSQIIFKLNQDFESIFIKMMLNYFWIFSLIFTFNISFTISFNFIDKASNTSYSMANNLDCYLSEITIINLLYLKVFTIIIIILWQFLIIFSIFLINCIYNKEKFKFRIVSNILLCLYIFNYQGLIKMQLLLYLRLGSIVSLREISNQQYVQGDVSIKYNSESHFQWMLFFIVPFLIIFGGLIPFFLFLIIVIQKEHIEKGEKMRAHISYLLNEYEKKCYYWEQIKLLQKAIMILILTYFETNILMKASLLGLCLLFYQLLSSKNRPFITSKLNNLDLQSGQICSISIFLATTKYVSEEQNNKFSSMILQIILILLFIMLSYPFILSILIIYFKKYKILFMTYLGFLMKKLKLKYLQNTISEVLKKEDLKQAKLKQYFLKLRKYLMSISKSQIKNRPLAPSKKINQQNVFSTEFINQSMNILSLDRGNM